MNSFVAKVAPIAAMLAIAAGALVAPGSGAARAGADPIGNCTTTTGTIVAVDFAAFDGPLVRGCGVSAPNGFALLQAAGFTTAGDTHDGPTFVCRLGNEAFQHGTQFPTPEQDACHNTPPPSAYWSYWVAPSGQDSWTYSPRGATGDTPKPGEVELWTFGGTDVGGTTGGPTFDPDVLRARNTTPAGGTTPAPSPTTRAPTTAPSQPVTQSGASGPPATVGRTSQPPPPTAPPPTPPDRTPTTTAVHTSTSSAGAASGIPSSSTAAPAAAHTPPLRIVDALPAAHQHASSGSVAPLLIALGLVVVLGAATAGTVLRRRHQE